MIIYKLNAVIRFLASKRIPDSDVSTIENGATDRLKGELEGYLKSRGIDIEIAVDYGDLTEAD